MKMFIEKQFIEKLESDRAALLRSKLYEIITNYPQLILFTDFDYTVDPYSNTQFETLELYKNKGNIPPRQDSNIDNNWKNYSLIFTFYEKEWFAKSREEGILCFKFDDYEKAISQIIEKYSYRIDLSEEEFNWTKLHLITFSKILRINDKYILVDKAGQKIENNLFKLLKRIDVKDNIKTLEIYTKAQESNENKQFAINKLVQKLNFLKAGFSHLVISVFNVDKRNEFDFHDRMIMSEYQLVECGKGFNLIPHKKSNSNIISNTIFDLYTYKRLKNLERAHLECAKYLKNMNQFFITKYPES